MKRLFTLLALCLPIYLFAQGFGSFTHDQPYFAIDRVAGGGGGSSMPTTNLFLWYKADNGAYSDASMTTLSTNGGTVLRWTNSISTNFAGTAMVDSDVWPKYYTNIINGKPALLFSGDGWHSGIKAGGVGGGSNYIDQPYQVFMVYNCTNKDVQGALWAETAYGAIGNFIHPAAGGFWNSSGAGSVVYDNGPINEWRIHQFHGNTTSTLMRTNGVLAKTGNFANTNLNGFLVGDLLPFTSSAYRGWVAEVLIYQPALSSNDAFQVEWYLSASNRYSITNSVLTPH